MELGKKQVLTVVKQVDFGVYLGSDEEKVLLPKKQVPEGIELGDPVEVFLYRDSSDRMIATTKEPRLTLGETAYLEVVQVGKMGAFLDWGLEKDLFLPFREQTMKIKEGDRCVAALYVDKSGRLCATMKVYPYLRKDSPYQKDDEVEGVIYESSKNFGMFVAVDEKYSALIPKKEVTGELAVGQHIHARVTEVKEDGKLDLSVRQKAFVQLEEDAVRVFERMEQLGGELPFNDKADAEVIRAEFGFSKSAFKRAVGHLYKQRKIEIREKTLAIIEK